MRLTTARVRDALAEALDSAVRDLVGGAEIPDLELARARNPAHGDYASPAGLKLARILKRPPPEIAQEVAARVQVADGAGHAEALGGYVNFRLSAAWLRELVRDVAEIGSEYGRSDLGRGERVQVEFVSVNPTGPLHIGHGRGAILGDTLARVLEFTGHAVEREYYVNDYGTQAQKFGESISARMRGEEPPAGGYVGEYVTALAESIAAQRGSAAELTLAEIEEIGIKQAVELIRSSLDRLNVHFDSWFFESRLWDERTAPDAVLRLERSGHVRERDGAKWFVAIAEETGDEEDRVVVRRDGQPTYFASDIGYLVDRFEKRRFERVIEVWGADHHGYVARMKAAAAALGIDPARLVIILMQIVHLQSGRMSKREGRLVTLDELVDAVGVDAVRYFYLLRSPEAMMNFDLELATSRSNDNPVYYAQYAYARLANVETFARERELPEIPDLGLLREDWELDLARQLAFWPESVNEAARWLEPHRLPYYVHELADRVHAFYQAGNRDWRHRVVVDDAAVTRARVELCRAARNTLKSALDLMGVSAPERM